MIEQQQLPQAFIINNNQQQQQQDLEGVATLRAGLAVQHVEEIFKPHNNLLFELQ